MSCHEVAAATLSISHQNLGRDRQGQKLGGTVKVLVYPHNLAVGGVARNAIDLARAISTIGHDVAIFSNTDGRTAMLSALEETGVPHFRGHSFERRRRREDLQATIDRFRPDLVHCYQLGPTRDLVLGAHLQGLPLVTTDYDMKFERAIPRHLPLVMGTQALAEEAGRARPGPVHLLEPPVDTVADRPGIGGGLEFRRSLGLGVGDHLVVIVTRLAQWKADSVLTAMKLTTETAHDATLAVVGDGSAAPSLQEEARSINVKAGRVAVAFAGEMVDPRPAYDAADVVVGMGGSALRGMAFGKPTVVAGSRGFAIPFTEETAEWLLYHGFYGVGANDEGVAQAVFDEWLSDGTSRKAAGQFSRSIVEKRFSLTRASSALDGIYRETLELPIPPLARWEAATRQGGREVVRRVIDLVRRSRTPG